MLCVCNQHKTKFVLSLTAGLWPGKKDVSSWSAVIVKNLFSNGQLSIMVLLVTKGIQKEERE